MKLLWLTTIMFFIIKTHKNISFDYFHQAKVAKTSLLTLSQLPLIPLLILLDHMDSILRPAVPPKPLHQPIRKLVTTVNSSLFLGYGIQGDVGLPGDPGQPMINGVVEFVGFPKGDKGKQVCWKTNSGHFMGLD